MFGRSALCLLVVVGDQAIQEAHTPARAPALVDVVAGGVHGCSGHVDVGPGRVLDEALQELGGGDGAAVASADVLHVGVLAVDQLVVALGKRHAPDLLAGRLAGGRQLGGQPLVVGEQTRI